MTPEQIERAIRQLSKKICCLSLSSIASGTYTPTLSNLLNITAATPGNWQYMRVGDVVTVSGSVTVEPTAAASTLTEFEFDLPIASDFNVTGELSGTLWGFDIASNGGQVTGTGSNGICQWNSQGVSETDIFIHFTYIIIITPP